MTWWDSKVSFSVSFGPREASVDSARVKVIFETAGGSEGEAMAGLLSRKKGEVQPKRLGIARADGR